MNSTKNNRLQYYCQECHMCFKIKEAIESIDEQGIEIYRCKFCRGEHIVLVYKQTKEDYIRQFKELNKVYKDGMKDIPECTCEKCGMVDKCEYAWDIYNSNCDCLAEH